MKMSTPVACLALMSVASSAFAASNEGIGRRRLY